MGGGGRVRVRTRRNAASLYVTATVGRADFNQDDDAARSQP